MNEMSFLLPHLLKDGRGQLDVYFTRVYNPVWTNPDGFSWIEALTDETQDRAARRAHADLERDGLLRRLRPADGPRLRAPRPALLRDARRAVARLPPAGAAAARERLGETVHDTREVNPGEVWEENEFWIELTWRIDPDGALGIRQYVESKRAAGREARRSTSTTAASSRTPCPGLPERAAAERLTPLEFMRRYGAFEIAQQGRRRSTSRTCRAAELDDVRVGSTRPRLHARAEAARRSNIVPRAHARRRRRRPPAGRRRDRRRDRARLPDAERPARVLLADAGRLGLARVRDARYIKSHVHPEQPRAGRDAAHLRPSACPCRSTRAAPTRSGSTRSRTPTRSGFTRRDAARLGVAHRRSRARRNARSATSS